MSNRLFQTIINQMKDVLGHTIGVIDENGIIIACSEFGKIGESRQRIREELSYAHGPICYEGYSYRFITSSTAAVRSNSSKTGLRVPDWILERSNRSLTSSERRVVSSITT